MTFLQSLFKGRWPHAILYDLDGTLVDSAPDIALATDEMLQELGMQPAGKTKVSNWVGNGAMMLIRRALVDDIRGNAEEHFTSEEISSAEKLFFEAYGKYNGETASLFPGVVEFLREARELGIEQAIVTNKPVRFVGPLLDRLEISGYFSEIVGGDSLEVKKPEPDPLFHAASQLGVDIEQALMVGDSRNDVEAALSAGARIACVSYGYSQGVPLLDYPLDWYGDNLMDLLA